MALDIQEERQQAHACLDRLPDAQVVAVRGLLEAMLDLAGRRAADDEPVTAEDRRRLQEGQRWFAERGGKGIPMEDVLAEFGVKPDDLR